MRRLPVFLFVAALALIVAVLGAACGGDSSDVEATATAEALAEEIAPSLTATAEAREEAEREAAIATAQAQAVEATATAVASIGLTRDKPVPFGQAKIVPEQGWEITVVEFTPDATQTVLALDPNSNSAPDSGFKYVTVRVRATNVSAGDPADFDAINALRLVGSRNFSYGPPRGCVVTPEGLGVAVRTEVFAGATIEGTVCFQVGQDESGFVMFTAFLFGGGVPVYFSVD